MSPDKPFLVSDQALPHSSTSPVTSSSATSSPLPTTAPPPMTIAQFACLFDYGQHLKRHQRLTPRILPVNSKE